MWTWIALAAASIWICSGIVAYLLLGKRLSWLDVALCIAQGPLGLATLLIISRRHNRDQ